MVSAGHCNGDDCAVPVYVVVCVTCDSDDGDGASASIDSHGVILSNVGVETVL